MDLAGFNALATGLAGCSALKELNLSGTHIFTYFHNYVSYNFNYQIATLHGALMDLVTCLRTASRFENLMFLVRYCG